MLQPEFHIENAILTWLNFQPFCFAFKIETRGYYDSKKKMYRKNRNKFVIPGTSDILAVIYGRFVAIEVKSPAGIKIYQKQKTETVINQAAFLAMVNQKGGFGICVSSLEEVQAFFQTLVKPNH